MKKKHHYSLKLIWTGNRGTGTSSYTAYSRDHSIRVKGKPKVALSSDPAFRGDSARYNPEELLLASLSSCHMLWYLHLCADNGITILEYEDDPQGTLTEWKDGSGRFTEVVLKPHAQISDESNIEMAIALHAEATKMCFIANSVNFSVVHEPIISVYPG